MKGKILNNISLKILSILGAIFLWASIVNIYDPSQGVTISAVNVQIINANSLTDKGYTYEVVDGSKINVYISGPGSIVSEIKSSDIVATADLSKVTAFTDYVDIEVRVEKEGVSASSIEVTPKTTALKLNIENRETKKFDIKINVTGEPSGGYILGETQISPASINITGAASEIERIAWVEAVYDVSGATMDINDTAKIVLYDSSENIINSDKLELSKKTVGFKAVILPTKTVPLNISTRGQIADGYRLSEIQYSNTEVIIAGTQEQLSNIEEINVTDEFINISGLKEDTTFEIDIRKYIPNNVKLISDSTVTAVAKVIPVHSREITVPISNITLVDIPDGYTASIAEEATQFKIIIVGNQDIISKVTAEQITGTVSLTGVEQGVSSINISFNLPEGCGLQKTYNIKVSVNKNDNPSTESSTENSTGETR